MHSTPFLVLKFTCLTLLVLNDAHLAWLPPTAAGLSLDGGCIQSAIALDREMFLLNAPRPDWCWSTTYGKTTTYFMPSLPLHHPKVD